MRPMNVRRPWPKDPFARKFQEILERRGGFIRGEIPFSNHSQEVKDKTMARYLSLFKAFLYDIIELNTDDDKFSNKNLLEVRNILKSVSTEGIAPQILFRKYSGVTSISDSCLTQIFNNEHLIFCAKGESINNCYLTKNGKNILLLLEEYLYLSGEISETSFTDERINQSDPLPSWYRSPTFQIGMTGWDIESLEIEDDHRGIFDWL